MNRILYVNLYVNIDVFSFTKFKTLDYCMILIAI